jgi:putative redox protein
MPSCKAVWTDGVRFIHTSGSGHALVSDAPETVGGSDSAPTPMELVLHALCGCMGVDLAGMLAKMRQPWTGLEISAEGERADDHPRIYTRIALHVAVTGTVDEAKLQRAVALSLDTYCSVAAMLRATAEIVPTWEIRP